MKQSESEKNTSTPPELSGAPSMIAIADGSSPRVTIHVVLLAQLNRGRACSWVSGF